MARKLQDLLTSNEPLFTFAISQLERSTGSAGVDVRLIADITHKLHETMRYLGLDPADTTARELYLALNAYVVREDLHELLFDTDYVLARIDDHVISLNYIDIIENIHHQLTFEDRVYSHGQRALRGEIIDRYLQHPQTSAATTEQHLLDAGLLGDHSVYDKPVIYENQVDILTKETTMSKPYILAIGDIFSDAFIALNQDVARIETDENGEKRISLPLGSKPPYDGVEIVKAVGPAPNAAVAIARLGLKSGLDSFIGDDEVGREAIDYLHEQNVDTSTMLIQEGIKTSYYFVLRYGAERTILVKNEQFDYRWEAPVEEPEWIYLALISDASWQFHEDLLQYLQAHPNVKLAFQPGTFHFNWGVEKLAGIYGRSHIVVMNREEAVDVTGKSYDSINELAHALHDLGPDKVVITDGPNGSYASYDFKLVTIPNFPDPAAPVDRTGAGDAFASTIVGALALGESMDTALTWAPINSAYVVQQVGAQTGLLTKEELQQHLEQAPEWYKVTDFEG